MSGPFWEFILICGTMLLVGCVPQNSIPPAANPVEVQPKPSSTVADLLPTAEPAQPSVTPGHSTDPASWVWVVNETDKTVLRVDPKTNTITATVELNGKPEIAIPGEGAVWVIEQASNGGSHIVRIDTNTVWPDVSARLPVVKGTAVSISPGAGSVWVGIAEPFSTLPTPTNNVANLPGGLLRIDPSTNQPSSYTAQNSVPVQILSDQDTLWLLEWTSVQSLLDHFNPSTGEHFTLPTVIDSPSAVYQFNRFASNPAGLWAISTDTRSRFVFKINPSDGKITQLIPAGLDPGDHPVDLVAGMDSIWVALENGKVVRIDPIDGTVRSVTELSDHLARIYQAAGSIWVENRVEAQLYRIDPQTNQVIAVINTGSKLEATATPLPRQRPGPACKASYTTRLTVGGRAIVKSTPPVPNRLREEPSMDSKLVGQIMPGIGMTILEGPVCNKNWLWWKVLADETNLIGWTAEGDEKGYWLSPVSTK